MRSFIGWVGGKSRLAGDIVKLFPEHKTYVEVFGGAGWVMFKKDREASQVEVYNDLNGALANLFRVVKHRPSELVEALNLVLYSRETYYRFLKEIDHPGEDEIQTAARFIYLIRNSFGSRVANGWGYAKTRKPRTITDLAFLNEIQERLKSVFIDNRSFEKVISAFDSRDTLFYLDPPYWIVGDKLYQHSLSTAEHEKLSRVLQDIKGRFVLSYNDVAHIRDLYRGFSIKVTKEIHYSLNNQRDTALKKSEILITNY